MWAGDGEERGWGEDERGRRRRRRWRRIKRGRMGRMRRGEEERKQEQEGEDDEEGEGGMGMRKGDGEPRVDGNNEHAAHPHVDIRILVHVTVDVIIVRRGMHRYLNF